MYEKGGNFKLKKIIYLFSIIFLCVIFILNILFTANLNSSEVINIDFNNLIYIFGLIISGTLIFLISQGLDKKLNNVEPKKKKILLVLVFSIYIIITLIWTILINPRIIADQLHASNLAQAIHRNSVEDLLKNNTYAGIPFSTYLVAYPQQITLAVIYSIFFKFVFSDIIELLRIINFISIIFIVLALYKIKVHLSQKYKINNVLFCILILTFLTLPMLSTFVYGDIPSIALCLWAIYFVMKYTNTQKLRFIFYATFLTALAYMMRMNSLIFIIATAIYLCLNLFKDFNYKNVRENFSKIFIILIYLVLSIVPSILVQNSFFNKYNIDHTNSYPRISYFLMGMEEGRRGNGWYNEGIAEKALKNPQNISAEYSEKIKDRLNYFSRNIGYCFNFYIMKIASMWTENTYSAINNNSVNYISLDRITTPLTFYQKVLLLISCFCSLVFLIKNRKNLSLEIIFLMTIFIGGFAFHILWEAKSRYIIPYILVLIPIASIKTEKNKTI